MCGQDRQASSPRGVNDVLQGGLFRHIPLVMFLFLFCVSRFFSPNTFKPDLLFKFSQTPTSGNTNIVKFFPIILLLKVKTMTVDSLTGKINKISFCLNVKVLCLLFAK